ncbi:UNVERIFIED_CONTAM: hypothetical protein GTU68_065810 [Idotea baltica]|nr:hypothetical protein [Idotea baltica]
MIAFYVASDEHGYLCNFSAHGFTLDGDYWPTVEHYFQAQKFVGTEYAQRIRAARTPKEAKNLGMTRKITLRSDWEEVKVDVMQKAVFAKFKTHTDLAEALVETGNDELVENAPGDYFWGCGKMGTGQNWLGKILMEVRCQLQEPEAREP